MLDLSNPHTYNLELMQPERNIALVSKKSDNQQDWGEYGYVCIYLCYILPNLKTTAFTSIYMKIDR